MLKLVGALCGLALFAFAAWSFVAASVRVGLRRRVLVLPLRGNHERRVEITEMLAARLMTMEGEWIARVRELDGMTTKLADECKAFAPSRDPASGQAPLTSDAPIPMGLVHPADRTGADRSLAAIGAAPRAVGDETFEPILLLGESSVADADLGVVSVAGVSFSPGEILALLRRLPGVFARRVLSGTVVDFGASTVFTAGLEERRFRAPPVRISASIDVEADAWPAAIELMAYRLNRDRVSGEALAASRPRRRYDASSVGDSLASATARSPFVEAESWEACVAFLDGYRSQFQHWLSGSSRDRETAVERYTRALEVQPSYARAAYNLATLLYNRYQLGANTEAIRLFSVATESLDDRTRALALAGLSMSYGQAVNRFGLDAGTYVPKAVDASQRALAIDDTIEEPHFARAWARQIDGDAHGALEAYQAVIELDTDTAAGRRLKSFALNNQGWLWLKKLEHEPASRRTAEQCFWNALAYYPNKIAYDNLAEVARLEHRYDDSLALFDAALRLDESYVNAWNERAILNLELAAAHAERGEREESARCLADAKGNHERATSLADDDRTKAVLRDAFEAAARKLGVVGEDRAAAPAGAAASAREP